MIDLKKEEISLFLQKVKDDKKHFNKYLFYKLQYFYGRRSQEIAVLKINDINFDKREITFDLAKKKQDTKLTLILPDDLAKEIRQQFENTESHEDYIFVENELKIDGFKRNMRTFLERNSNKIINEVTGKNLTLNTHDFRRLRGQHLYLAGNDLEIIQSLYAHNSLDQTIEYLQIKEIEVNKMLLADIS
ncbi:tyrosine recombinase XerC [Methanobrevibacter cuticularis]|uniref:Tyrosine recombinase XerC n=1 Tax=Methanobrevibacter cuticularis TaxID=47311 RepID=A0A166DKU0_9EURY|nr:site-specific integrase [Methanobrevibacter cuticularis]KZX15698.1 tyrosine recombinase XerC [Methanobrevibacter cuticularis]